MKDNPVFGSFGRFQETPKAEMPPDMKAAFDFTMRLRGEVPGPHKIWICNPKLSEISKPSMSRSRSTVRPPPKPCQW